MNWSKTGSWKTFFGCKFNVSLQWPRPLILSAGNLISNMPTDACNMRVWLAFIINFQLTCKSSMKPATVNPLKKNEIIQYIIWSGYSSGHDHVYVFFYIIIYTGRLLLLQGQRKSLIKRPINDAPNLRDPAWPHSPTPPQTPAWSVTFPI